MSSRSGLKGKEEEARARGSCLEIWGRFLRVLPQNPGNRAFLGGTARPGGGRGPPSDPRMLGVFRPVTVTVF